MIFKNCGMNNLLSLAQNKTLICFGAGRQLTHACEAFSNLSFFERIDMIADNNKDKKTFFFREYAKPVYSIEQCLQYAKSEPVILITVIDYSSIKSIVRQLNSIEALQNCEFYVCMLVQACGNVEPYTLKKDRSANEPVLIPKKIHYCWFGGAPIPKNFTACIESWKKYCPDYEIIRWDEGNYDYKKNEYMYEAYKQKKWGFVPDYARLDIVYNYGGVYLDTDVELVRNIDDLLCDEAFCGFQNSGEVAFGLGFGAIAGFPLIREQMEAYENISFVNNDGSLNLTPAPVHAIKLFEKKGLIQNNTLQKIQGMTIYPSDVLAPLDNITRTLAVTDNTYAIHHYAATWQDEATHEKKRQYQQMYTRLIDTLEDINNKQRLIEKHRNTEGKIKVLHFPLRNNRGGIAKYILENWKFINREEFVFDFITFADVIDFEDELLAEGCKIHRVSCLPSKDEKRFYQEINAILDEGYDAIHLHTSRWTGMQIEEIAVQRNVPNIIIHSHSSSTGVPEHNKELHKQFANTHERLRNKLSCNWKQYATNLCACSDIAARWLFGDELAANEVILLSNAVAIDAFAYDESVRNQYRQELNLENCFVIGHVGRIDASKNHDFIIRVFSKVVHLLPEARLVLIGSGSDIERVNTLTQEYGIANKTRFLGFRDDVSKLLQAIDVFILPSTFEGMPISLIEAQTAGLRCLVSDRVTPSVKIVPDLHFFPLEERVWCDALVKVAQEEYERKDRAEMVENSGYSIKGSVKILERLYRGELRR